MYQEPLAGGERRGHGQITISLQVPGYSDKKLPEWGVFCWQVIYRLTFPFLAPLPQEAHRGFSCPASFLPPLGGRAPFCALLQCACCPPPTRLPSEGHRSS